MILTALFLTMQVTDTAATNAVREARRPPAPVRARPLVVVDAGHGSASTRRT
jgi:hypothetical protein